MNADNPSPHHVVVGCGSAGIILCARLLAKGNKVTIVTTAQSSKVPESKSNDAWVNRVLKLMPKEDIWTYQATDCCQSKKYFSLEQKALFGRRIAFYAGIGIGGTSNINAMMYGLGHRGAFDLWPKPWTFEMISAYDTIVDNLVSPGIIQTSGNIRKIILSILDEACEESSSKSVILDYNASINSPEGRRCNANLNLLRNSCIMDGQLQIVNSAVRNVKIINRKAVSVTLENGDTISPTNRGEIVLCTGVFETPRILFNSLNIDAQKSGFEMGVQSAKFVDHLILPLIVFGNWYSGWNKFRENLGDHWKTPNYPINSVHGWVFLDEDGNFSKNDASTPPKCQLVFLDGQVSPWLAELLLPRFSESKSFYSSMLRPFLYAILKFISSWVIFRLVCGNVWGVLICLLQPESSGRIGFEKETTSNTCNKISIDPCYLTDSRDKEAVYKAFLRAKSIVANAKIGAKMNHFEILPGLLFNYADNYSSFERYLSLYGSTYFHGCGSCAMPMRADQTLNSVVDSQLRVRGVQGLRVADASVIPSIPAFPIAKTCMIIGAAAADFLQNQKSP